MGEPMTKDAAAWKARAVAAASRRGRRRSGRWPEALRDAAGAYGREAEPEAEFVRDWLRAEADRIGGGR